MIKFLRNLDSTRKSSLINFVLKPLNVLLGIVYTPLLLSYLGAEKYGLWATILSIINWINYCDVGIGHGLRNLVTKELVCNDEEGVRKSVATAYVILSIISMIVLFVCIIIVFSLDWKIVFSTEENMRVPLLISFVFICLNFVLALSNSLLYALQLSERVAIRSCLVQLLNIVGVFLLMQVSSGNLILLSILFGATSSIIYLYNTIYLFNQKECFFPKIKNFSSEKIKYITNTGLKFFIIQIDCLALYTVDNILISHYFGAASVTPFNITYRIFETCYAFLAALVLPYWSKTTEAFSKEDYNWIKKSSNNLYVIAAIFCVGYVLVAILFKQITFLWLGEELNYPAGLEWIMCIYYCLFSFVCVSVQFINGTGKINFQLILMTILGIANIPLSIFLSTTCSMGVFGIRFATTILIFIAAIAFPINHYFIIRREEKKNEQIK